MQGRVARATRTAKPVQPDNFRWWRGWPATVLLLIVAAILIYMGIGLWWLAKK